MLAIHKKTGQTYKVIAKDKVGTLIEIKGLDGITITTNSGYYDFKNDELDKISNPQKV